MTATWNWVDWVLVIYVVFSAARGLRLGFIRSVLGLAGIVAGVVVAYFYSPALAGWLETRFGMVARMAASLETMAELPVPIPLPIDGAAAAHALVHGLAFAALILAVAGMAAAVARILSGGARYVGLGFVDNFFGIGFGMLKALATAVVIFGLVISFSHMSGLAWVITSLAESTFAPGLIRIFFAVSPWTPGT